MIPHFSFVWPLYLLLHLPKRVKPVPGPSVLRVMQGHRRTPGRTRNKRVLGARGGRGRKQGREKERLAEECPDGDGLPLFTVYSSRFCTDTMYWARQQ